MKKIFLFVFIILLNGCSNQTTDAIWTYDWELETLSDSEGLIASNVEGMPSHLQYDMWVEFNQNGTFILHDYEEDSSWSGVYQTEKIDTDYKLDMTFDNAEKTYIGAYGLRFYEDETEVPTITLTIESKILTFLGH